MPRLKWAKRVKPITDAALPDAVRAGVDLVFAKSICRLRTATSRHPVAAHHDRRDRRPGPTSCLYPWPSSRTTTGRPFCKRVARRLQEDYLEFLRLLLLVACSPMYAHARAWRALDIGLRRNDLPSGRLSSWGAATPDAGDASDLLRAGDLSQRFFKAASAHSAPRYLTVWHHQRTQRAPLGREAFVRPGAPYRAASIPR